MKALNYKERNNRFTLFVIAGIITLCLTIFCFYFTNNFLIGAISNEKIEQYSRFQRYRSNQSQYVKYLEKISIALAGNMADPTPIITDFRNSFTSNGDTSQFMNKIVDLSNKTMILIDHKNSSLRKLGEVKRELNDCNDAMKSNTKTN